jgi:hypothetical protein
MQVVLWPDTMREIKLTAVRYTPGMPVYVRYGLWSRKSTNYHTFQDEQGVSAYRGIILEGVLQLLDEEEVSPELEGQGRLCFPVTGREIGIGSDGEPLLKGVKYVTGVSLHVSLAR